jgi:hypothetical protein
MAGDVSVPNTFSNGTTADAPEVNANFAALVAWINTNVTHLDASKAFTAIPTGPATDPTTANQFTRKSYVDAKIWANANFTDNTISGTKLTDVTVTTGKIADLAVTTAKINDLAVTTGKIAADAVTGAQLADDAVGSEHIEDGAVGSLQIANNSITTDHISPGDFDDIKNIKWSDYCGRAEMSGNQSIAHNTTAFVAFDAADVFDYGAMHDPASNNTRVTAPVAGVWTFHATVQWEGNVSGWRRCAIIRYNSAGVLQEYVGVSFIDAGDYNGASGIASLCQNPSGVVAMDAGDYVQVEVWQAGTSASLDLVDFGITSTISWSCHRLN